MTNISISPGLHPEDGGSKVLWKVGYYAVSQSLPSNLKTRTWFHLQRVVSFSGSAPTAPSPWYTVTKNDPFNAYWDISMGVKRSWREADHSPPSSVAVKNAWGYTSIPPIRIHDMVLN